MVALADQATKWAIVALVMQPPHVIPLTGFFNVVLVENRGISFGLLGADTQWGAWLLAGGSGAIVGGLVLWLRRARSRLAEIGLALVIGGAVGNLIDRIRFGAVTDFLDFHAAGYHWPAFNLADSAIVVGVGLLMLDGLQSRPQTS